MSLQDYNSQIETILAIPDSAIISPNMPVAVALQEAEDLAQWCQADRKELESAGLDWNLVNNLPVRAGACRHAQSVWMKDSKTQSDAEKLWVEQSPAAFSLRDDLVHHFFHAFYNHPDLTRKVQAIAEGSSNADMLQDLSDLYVLGKANLPLLKAINLDESTLETAHTLSEVLAELLAKANGKDRNLDETKKIRDKAFTFMKMAVDEIRRHGSYVFWRNENRKQGYVSRFFKKVNRRREQTKEKAA